MDNHSMDKSWLVAKKTVFPRPFVCLERNIHFAAVNNLAGTRHIQVDWLFLLNPNAYPEPDCQKNIAKNFVGMPEIDCLACTLIAANHPKQLDSFEAPYFVYSEDVDAGFRLRLAGGSYLLLPNAKIYHFGPTITDRSSDFSSYQEHRNLTWTFTRNMPLPLLLLLLPVHQAMTVYAGIMFALTGRLRPYMRAKWDAFSQLGHRLTDQRDFQHQHISTCIEMLRTLCSFPRNCFYK